MNGRSYQRGPGGGAPWRGYYLTAYGLAVKNGFQGSEREWLDSLKGEQGDPGKDLVIKGSFDSESALREEHPRGTEGDYYFVGTGEEYQIFFWDPTEKDGSGDWKGFELRGPRGETGERGPTGPQGIRGEKGEKGLTGSEGPTGPRGATGPKGDPGSKGDAGDPGPEGPRGAKGDTGDSWVPSVDDAGTLTWKLNSGGIPESKNIRGPVGERGPVGPEGPEGKQGLTGDPGPKGDAGDVWVPNVDAETGDLSWEKNSGVEPGTVNIKGPKGDRGEIGPVGPAGPAGSGTGDMLASTYDPQNKATDIFKFANDAAANAVKDVKAGNVTFEDGQTFQDKLDAGELKGDRGETGPAGPAGEAGKDGAPGEQGAPGEPGQPGKDGAAAGFGAPTAEVDDGTGVPSVDITADGADTEKVFHFSFHNLKGEPGKDGQDGKPGADGAAGAPGTNGANGKDGFSPTVATDPVDGGTKVTIADAKGPHEFTVKDGAKGDKGDPGPKSDYIEVTLTVVGWGEGTSQTVSNSKFNLSGYNYIVGPAQTSRDAYGAADIQAEDVSVEGQMAFKCKTTPKDEIKIRIYRIAANEEE